jgi:hypothetical protein
MTGRNFGGSGRVKLDLTSSELAACIDSLLYSYPEATQLIRYLKNKWAHAEGRPYGTLTRHHAAAEHQADAPH